MTTLLYLIATVFCMAVLASAEQTSVVLMLHQAGLSVSPVMVAIVFTLAALLLSWRSGCGKRGTAMGHAMRLTVVMMVLFVATTILPPIVIYGEAPALSSVVVLGVAAVAYTLYIYARARRGGLTNVSPNTAAIALLLVGMGVSAAAGGTPERRVYEQRIDRLLANGRIDEALDVARGEEETSDRMVALRAYALHCKGQLGDRLFTYPLPHGLQSLQMAAPQHTLLCDSAAMAQIAVSSVDYRLCTLLLRKDLLAFARQLRQEYDIADSHVVARLPNHYKEALMLHNSLSTHPLIIYHNTTVEMGYSDFQDLCARYADPDVRRNYARRYYGVTYYWYYFFG